MGFYARLDQYLPGCDCGDEPVLVRMVARNGVLHAKRQCPRCGKASGSVAHELLPCDPRTLPALNEDLRRRERERISAEWATKAQQERDEWRRRYEEYLRSPAWSIRRKVILKRAGGRCEQCEREKPLEVHHTTYVHLGNERSDELAAVCRECHEQITAAQRAFNG